MVHSFVQYKEDEREEIIQTLLVFLYENLASFLDTDTEEDNIILLRLILVEDLEQSPLQARFDLSS